MHLYYLSLPSKLFQTLTPESPRSFILLVSGEIWSCVTGGSVSRSYQVAVKLQPGWRKCCPVLAGAVQSRPLGLFLGLLVVGFPQQWVMRESDTKTKLCVFHKLVTGVTVSWSHRPALRCCWGGRHAGAWMAGGSRPWGMFWVWLLTALVGVSVKLCTAL